MDFRGAGQPAWLVQWTWLAGSSPCCWGGLGVVWKKQGAQTSIITAFPEHMFGNSRSQNMRRDAAAEQTPQPASPQNTIFMVVLIINNVTIQQSKFHHQGHANEKRRSRECPRARRGPLNDPGGARGHFQSSNHHGCHQKSTISGQGSGSGFRVRV